MVRDIVTELLLVVPFYILHFAKNRVNHEALYKVWSRRDGVSFSGLAPHAAATTSHCMKCCKGRCTFNASIKPITMTEGSEYTLFLILLHNNSCSSQTFGLHSEKHSTPSSGEPFHTRLFSTATLQIKYKQFKVSQRH